MNEQGGAAGAHALREIALSAARAQQDKAADRLHAAGRLTAREAVGLLLDDPDDFEEWGLHARSSHAAFTEDALPADGVITGIGTVAGRRTVVCATDSSVKAGTTGEVGNRKIERLLERAAQMRTPVVWLLDSAGARIQESMGSRAFVTAGRKFWQQIQLSGYVPQVAVVMGPCFAGTAYAPALCDLIIMTPAASIALGGPRLVKEAVGEAVDAARLGGLEVHAEQSGLVDVAASDDATAIESARTFLGLMSDANGATPAEPRPLLPSDRLPGLGALAELGSGERDMSEVVALIADEDSCYPVKNCWAPNILTVLCRLGGAPIGVVANQPVVLGGAIDRRAADKAARFVSLCDAYDIPLLFLVDVPGFFVGSDHEREGIIRSGTRLLHSVSSATVPKVTLVTGKAFGAGYFAMDGYAFGCDRLLVWPGAQISVMGGRGAGGILGGERDMGIPEAWNADAYAAAQAGWVDDVIDPQDSRTVLARAFLNLRGKNARNQLPKKHPVEPY